MGRLQETLSKRALFKGAGRAGIGLAGIAAFGVPTPRPAEASNLVIPSTSVVEQQYGPERPLLPYFNPGETEQKLAQIAAENPTDFLRDYQERVRKFRDWVLTRNHETQGATSQPINPKDGLGEGAYLVLANLANGGQLIRGGDGYNSRLSLIKAIKGFTVYGDGAYLVEVFDNREPVFSNRNGTAFRLAGAFERNQAVYNHFDLSNELQEIITKHATSQGYDKAGAMHVAINRLNYIYNSLGGEQAGVGKPIGVEGNTDRTLTAGVHLFWGNPNPQARRLTSFDEITPPGRVVNSGKFLEEVNEFGIGLSAVHVLPGCAYTFPEGTTGRALQLARYR